MSEVEGVIKFNLDFKNESIVGIDVLELSAWRNLLRELGLLGKISGRYGGLSYGNISQRHEFGFLISAVFLIKILLSFVNLIVAPIGLIGKTPHSLGSPRDLNSSSESYGENVGTSHYVDHVTLHYFGHFT